MHKILFLGNYCMNGIRRDDICCMKNCGQCGGKGCGSAPGGASKCCSGTIRKSGKICANKSDTACIIAGMMWNSSISIASFQTC